MGVTKVLASMSEQINKQLKKMLWETAHIAQAASKGYDKYLSDRHGSKEYYWNKGWVGRFTGS